MSKIQPGRYSAKILDYGVGDTKTGNLQIMILLEYTDAENETHEITWFGSLKEGKAREITMETLLNCGLRGNDITLIGEGVVSRLLDVDSPLTIAVIEHEYEGKKSMRVQWINRGGAGALSKKLDAGSAKAKLASLNLKGEVMAARQLSGIKDEPKKAPTPLAMQAFDDFDSTFGPA